MRTIKIRIVTVILLLLGSLNVTAEEKPYMIFETPSLRVVLRDDGTGIINEIGCPKCGFRSVRITKRSKVTINGKEVSIFRARDRLGKPAMVSFNPKTAEVQYIRWYE